jgi:diguanylate cyclase (GGDEF)-like protein
MTSPRRRTSPVETAAGFLGVPEGELTPAVAGAIEALTSEIDDLRRQVELLKRRAEAAEALAERDALTGVFNRRGFERELRRMMALARRHKTEIALLYIDLDGFKAVNDTLGHAAGDEALRRVAQILLENVRESDVVGRLGGDEFGVALLQAGLGQANAKARTLQALIGSEVIEVGDRSATLGASFGVREYESQSLDAFLAEADAAMFVRKRSAR